MEQEFCGQNSFWAGRSVTPGSGKSLLELCWSWNQQWESFEPILGFKAGALWDLQQTQPDLWDTAKAGSLREDLGLDKTLCAAQVVAAVLLAFIWSSSPSTATFFCMLTNTPCWYPHTHLYIYFPTCSGCAHPEYFFHTGINFCAKSAGLNEGRILKLSMLCVFWREFTGTESMTMTVTHWETQGSPLKWNLKRLEK